MAKPTMPKITSDGESGGGGASLIAEEWIKIAGAIGAHEDLPGKEILQRETKRVIFHGAIVITDKFTSAA